MAHNAYDQHKESARQRQAEISRKGRDIGPLPPPENPDRRDECRHSLRQFCETYLASVFYLGWSEDHLKVITRLEDTIRTGGLYALAMSRGSGKTSLLIAAVLWATVYGYRRNVVVISANAAKAKSIIDVWKHYLSNDAAFQADFPDVCKSFAALENISVRAHSQLCDGEPTNVVWQENCLCFPRTAPSQAWLQSIGIEGNIRGTIRTNNKGEIVRPDLVFLDDIGSDLDGPSTVTKQLSIINGAVLNLSGPDKRIACLAAMTIIQEGDVASQLLDRKKNPLWTGEVYKLVYDFPTNTELWDRYAALYVEHPEQATPFYLENRAAMDAGARVAWAERYDRGTEISAVQHAMNLRIRDLSAFMAEMQNEPITAALTGAVRITPDTVQTNGLKRGEVPREAAYTTAYVDVQQGILFYVVTAWSADFTGWVIDWGNYPEQPRADFTVSSLPLPLTKKHEGGIDAALSIGLEGVLRALNAKYLPKLILVDSGYKTPLVKAVIRKLCLPNIMPAKGVGITAKQNPLAEWRKKPGEVHGWGYVIRTDKTVIIDTNTVKTHMAESLTSQIGQRGNLSLWGRDIRQHAMLLNHLAAEYAVPTHGRGRDLWEWQEKPGKPDNHLLDCLTGATLAASVCGAKTASTAVEQKARKRYTAEDLQKMFRKS